MTQVRGLLVNVSDPSTRSSVATLNRRWVCFRIFCKYLCECYFPSCTTANICLFSFAFQVINTGIKVIARAEADGVGCCFRLLQEVGDQSSKELNVSLPEWTLCNFKCV